MRIPPWLAGARPHTHRAARRAVAFGGRRARAQIPPRSLTHLVTAALPPSGKPKRRTIKLALALLRGTPVVAPSWVLGAVGEGSLGPHEPHTVLELAEELRAPLKGEVVFVHGPFAQDAPEAAMLQLVKEAGGARTRPTAPARPRRRPAHQD